MELIFNRPSPIEVPLTIGSWEGLSVPLDFAITYTHSFRSHKIDTIHHWSSDNHDHNFYIHSYKVFIQHATKCRSCSFFACFVGGIVYTGDMLLNQSIKRTTLAATKCAKKSAILCFTNGRKSIIW
jgi:hypothetical protein